MVIRTALRQSKWITFGLLLVFLWVLLAAMGVLEVVGSADWAYLGQGAISGIAGLLVMVVALGLLVVLFGELTETEPGPEPWPPDE